MTTDTATRANVGGFEDRYRVTRTDGKPISADRRYLVLAYDGSDPAAYNAINTYAEYIECTNPQMAADLRDALVNPTKYPAQHD
jgi:hypothetical protein